MCMSKRIMWIISKSHREKYIYIYIFAIHSSSKHEKYCQMFVRLFCLFQCSRNQQWMNHSNVLYHFCKWLLVHWTIIQLGVHFIQHLITPNYLAYCSAHFLLGNSDQALCCNVVAVKGIEIIHRLFLVIAMYTVV